MKEYVQQGGALLVTVGEGGEAAFGSAVDCNLRPTPHPGPRTPDPGRRAPRGIPATAWAGEGRFNYYLW